MKILRLLLALVLATALSGIARADDFQMVIIDPTVPVDLLQPVYNDNFALQFPTSGPAAGCQPSQLQGIPTADQSGFDACFTGINLTGASLTSIQLELPVFTLPNQSSPDTASCPTFSSDEFQNISCTLNSTDTDYILDFSGGAGIPTATIFNSLCFYDPFPPPGFVCDSPAIFTIAIGFPDDPTLTTTQITQVLTNDVNSGITADANVVTPEPASLMLLSTGLLSLGLFGAYQRRKLLPLTKP